MAVIKYDVSGVEVRSDKVPPADVYLVKLITCVVNKPANKDKRIEVTAEIADGDFKGFTLRDWINLENEDLDWKLAEFIRSLGLPDKGGLDPAKVVGMEATVKTGVENSDEWGMQARLRKWLSPEDAPEGEEGEDLDDDDTEDGAEEEGDGTWTEEELNELAVKELVTIAKEAELDEKEIQKGKRTAAQKKEALVAAILEAQEEGDEDEEDGDEDGDDSELWTEDELGELDDDDLKAVMTGDPDDDEDEGFGLDPADFTKSTKNPKTKKTVKKFDRDAAIAGILEAQEGAEDEDEDGEDEDEAVDYNEMELADLKALLKERSLPVKGTKKILVARLEKSDEPV